MKILIDIPENYIKALEEMRGCGLGYYHELIVNGVRIPDEVADRVARTITPIHADLVEEGEGDRAECYECCPICRAEVPGFGYGSNTIQYCKKCGQALLEAED